MTTFVSKAIIYPVRNLQHSQKYSRPCDVKLSVIILTNLPEFAYLNLNV